MHLLSPQTDIYPSPSNIKSISQILLLNDKFIFLFLFVSILMNQCFEPLYKLALSQFTTLHVIQDRSIDLIQIEFLYFNYIFIQIRESIQKPLILELLNSHLVGSYRHLNISPFEDFSYYPMTKYYPFVNDISNHVRSNQPHFLLSYLLIVKLGISMLVVLIYWHIQTSSQMQNQSLKENHFLDNWSILSEINLLPISLLFSSVSKMVYYTANNKLDHLEQYCQLKNQMIILADLMLHNIVLTVQAYFSFSSRVPFDLVWPSYIISFFIFLLTYSSTFSLQLFIKCILQNKY